MSSNKEQPQQEDNINSNLVTLEEFVAKLKQDMAKWSPKDKAEARKALMDKYVHNKQNYRN